MKYIIDLDGTLMDGAFVNKDAKSFVESLENNEQAFIIMTNSMKSPPLIKERLERVGIQVATKQIMNPISSINVYLKKNNYSNAFVIGSQSEIDQIEVSNNDVSPAIVVLLDFERDNIDYMTLQKVFEFIQKGVPIIAASRSPYYLKDHQHVLDTGAFVKLFETAANISIDVLGKPSLLYFESALNLLDARPEEVTVIGDDWSTDMMGAKAVQCHSVLIQSGKYKSGDEDKCKEARCINQFSELISK